MEDTNTPMGLENVTTPWSPQPNNTTVSNQGAELVLVFRQTWREGATDVYHLHIYSMM